MKSVNNDLSKKYNRITIFIHGFTALLIVSLIPLGKYMSSLEITEKMGLVKLHAIMGMLVFILTIIRTFSFFKHERPEKLVTDSKLNDKVVVWIHNIFYVVLFGLALSGISAIIFGGYVEAFTTNNIDAIKPKSKILPLKVHCFMVRSMLALLILHIIGFIKHLIINKENTLKRII